MLEVRVASWCGKEDSTLLVVVGGGLKFALFSSSPSVDFLFLFLTLKYGYNVVTPLGCLIKCSFKMFNEMHQSYRCIISFCILSWN